MKRANEKSAALTSHHFHENTRSVADRRFRLIARASLNQLDLTRAAKLLLCWTFPAHYQDTGSLLACLRQVGMKRVRDESEYGEVDLNSALRNHFYELHSKSL